MPSFVQGRSLDKQMRHETSESNDILAAHNAIGFAAPNRVIKTPGKSTTIANGMEYTFTGLPGSMRGGDTWASHSKAQVEKEI